jgi:hypothetical protein
LPKAPGKIFRAQKNRFPVGLKIPQVGQADRYLRAGFLFRQYCKKLVHILYVRRVFHPPRSFFRQGLCVLRVAGKALPMPSLTREKAASMSSCGASASRKTAPSER